MSLSSRCPSLRIPRRPRHSTPPSAPHCPSAQHCPRHIAEDGDHPQHSTAAYFAARVTAAWIADFRRGPSYPRRILVTSKIRILIQMLSPPRHTLNNCRIGSPPNCLHKGLRAWTWCLRGTYAKILWPLSRQIRPSGTSWLAGWPSLPGSVPFWKPTTRRSRRIYC